MYDAYQIIFNIFNIFNIYQIMLNLVVIFNCHGAQYITQLEQSAKFKATYNCTYIPIYNYLQGGVLGNNLNFIQEDLDKIMSANVLLHHFQ